MEENNSIYKTIRVRSVVEELENFHTIVFEEGHDISYSPGQYLTLVRFEGGEDVRRSYSITSSPALNEPLAIGVKRVDNGMLSRILVDLVKPGDELTTIGAGGFFVLPSDIDNYEQVFYFAAGAGITPAFSMIKTALHAHRHLSVVLVYSNASPDKTIFRSALIQLQQQFPDQFTLKFHFSNSQYLAEARLNRELIISYLEKLVKGKKDKTMFYTCGPESYMRLCVYTLQAEGIEPQKIRKENFYLTDVEKRDSAPPDKNDRQAVIRFGSTLMNFTVNYPDSILKAAKKAGFRLPYSCEAGRCGNCVARCTKGAVWHSYNEVLTEKELSQGLILTCVGHPNGGDIELEI
ncbi:MAG: ferredoxin--NADP reductase [Chitinophagaceae bacterium]|nr:MAG: ferredoxin--NADP reductase [Chitinophagaceae bacterium]